MFQFKRLLRSEEAASGSAPIESAPPVAETPKVDGPKVRQVKVNGKMMEIPEDKIDFYIGTGLASTERFQQASQLQKEAQAILDSAKTDKSALKLLEKAGYSREEARKIVEDELLKHYEEDELPEDVKKSRSMEKKLAEYEAREKAEKDKLIADESDREVQAEMAKLDAEVESAFKKHGLPALPILGAWATNYMANAPAELDISAEDAVQSVHNDLKLVAMTFMKGLDGKALEAFLPAEVIKAIRDQGVAKVREAEAPFAKSGQQPAAKQDAHRAQSQPKPPEVLNSRDFFKRGM